MCDKSQTQLQKVVDGYKNYESMTGALDSDFQQKGGGTGYILDLELPRVGGQAPVTGYVSQPEYLNGTLVQQRTEDGRLMGDAQQCGGAKKKLNSQKKMGINSNLSNMMNNAKVNNAKVNNANLNNAKANNAKANNAMANQNKAKKSKKKSKKKNRTRRRYSKKHFKKHRGKKSHKFKKGMKKRHPQRKRGKSRKYHRRNKSKNRKKYHKKMRGGDGCSYEVQGQGQDSVFTHDMNERSFDCNQPNWDSKCT